MTTFFEPGHIYAARAGWPGNRERFRFHCTEVTTDRETGKPRAYGWHGSIRSADGAWVWSPNPRTHSDWGSWTDITDEPEAETNVYVNAQDTELLHDNEEFVNGEEYLDRHGDTWRFLGGILEFLHVKRADEKAPKTGPNIIRHCEDAALIARDFGPMTKVTEVAR
ncbi:hypothetical protein ACIA6D_23180 [Streptomyces cacaoi]